MYRIVLISKIDIVMIIKKVFKNIVSATLMVGLLLVCGATVSSCSSSKKAGTMYKVESKKSTMINKNFKVKGNNKNHRSTYRSY
jgi:hypothetical protein